MIRRVRLRQWRAYDALDLQLGEGTIFVVAANGVGKTSLVLGLAWGVFGEASKIDARACIRGGANSAEVELEILLPGDRILLIQRSVGLRGAAKTTASVDGRSVGEGELEKLLEDAYGIEIEVAARLALMAGGGALASRDALDLKTHLYKAFGIEGLLATTQVARKYAKEAEKRRGAVRTMSEAEAVDRKAIELEVTETRSTIALARERLREQEGAVRDAAAKVKDVEQLAAYEAELGRYDAELGKCRTECGSLLGDVDEGMTTSEMATVLRGAMRDLDAEAQRLAESLAAANGVLASAKDALGLLSQHVAQCPTCMRRMAPTQVASARAKHEERLRIAMQTVENSKPMEAGARRRMAELSVLIGRLEALRAPQPLAEVDTLPSKEAAQATHRSAMEALQLCNREVGSLEGQLRSLETRLANDTRAAEAEQELRVAYRREAIATAAAQAFDAAANEVLVKVIEPIAVEVRRRWQQLFPLEGLTLRPDGTVVRVFGGQEFDWSTLSGGERVWARIVTHLLVLASSTRLPFAWFDEPLEHLDPQLRRTVAATLATTTRHGYPKQLLVTTYEDALTRQLAEDTDTATWIPVRAAASVVRIPGRTPEEEATVARADRRAS